MTDEMLAHMCMLSQIKIMGMRCPNARENWMDCIQLSSHADLWNEWNTISILADTCAELMKRAEIKPRFKVAAATE